MNITMIIHPSGRLLARRHRESYAACWPNGCGTINVETWPISWTGIPATQPVPFGSDLNPYARREGAWIRSMRWRRKVCSKWLVFHVIEVVVDPIYFSSQTVPLPQRPHQTKIDKSAFVFVFEVGDTECLRQGVYQNSHCCMLDNEPHLKTARASLHRVSVISYSAAARVTASTVGHHESEGRRT